MGTLIDRLAVPLLFAISVAGANAAHGADAAAEFGVTRLATQPIIESGTEQEVCRLAREAMASGFRSGTPMLDAPTILAGPFKPVDFQPSGSADEYGREQTLAHLDLGGDSRHQTLVLSRRAAREGGFEHEAEVFSSQISYDELVQRHPDGVKFYPEATSSDGTKIVTGEGNVLPLLFRHKFRFYFPYGAGFRDALQSSPTTIYQLLPSGEVQKACVISQGHVYRPVQAFTQLKDVAAMLSLLQQVVDETRNPRQNEDSPQFAESQFHLEELAAVRPWIVASFEEEAAQEVEGDSELPGSRAEEWSFRHPKHRRQYLTLQALAAPAGRSLSRHLEKSFGMSRPAAEAGAARVIEGFIKRRFEQAGWNDPEAEMTQRNPAIVRSIIDRDRAKFDMYFEQAASMSDSKAIFSELLPQSVEWPYAFDRLLAAGADAGRPSASGKTPLMVAAEFNRPDAMRKLLAAGVNVDAKTGSGDWALAIHSRTALHYAAANADLLVIRMLIDAGANPSLKDSKELSPMDYLSGNPRLNVTSREKFAEELQNSAALPIRASFDCRKAASEIDQAICGSELLKMLDAEIAVPYAKLKALRGKAMVEEQKAWLSERNRSCGVPLNEDCLAESMSVRANELLLRAAEPKPRS